MRAPALLLLAVLLLAGCTTPPAPAPGPGPITETAAEGPTMWPVVCRLVAPDHTPIPEGSCHYRYGDAAIDLDVNESGETVHPIAEGTFTVVWGTAPGYARKEGNFTVRAPTVVHLALDPLPPGAPEETAPDGPLFLPPLPDSPGLLRRFLDPISVGDTFNDEPHIVVAPNGALFYAPTTNLYRSLDGGRTWEDVSPTITEALPVLAGDTSVNVAPDGSVWYSRYWGYPDGTIGCTSTNNGDTWTCDNLAIPGVTDRMWIVGLDATHGYVQTNQGLYHNQWAYTETGSLKYLPWAEGLQPIINTRNGNMVYEPRQGGVHQIASIAGTLQIARIDLGSPTVTWSKTPIPSPTAIPWIATAEGALWTTGEPEGADGGRTVLAARSTDGGRTWATFPIPSQAKSVTFSYAAAGPKGRVALVYYGADTPGAPAENPGTWSLYVAETSNGLDPNPTWIETRVQADLHHGPICIGLNCETTSGSENARFSGDLIGIAIDADGNAHVAYNEDATGEHQNLYVRQVLPTG